MMPDQEDPPSLVDKYIAVDSSFLQLHDALKGTVSGIQERDYPCLNNGLRGLTQLQQLTTSPFPAKILEQFNHVQQNSEMGIFSEISRAWLTVDSSLYLWSYDGDSIVYFDALTEVIIGVALVKPKPGIFKEGIKHILCLTTLVEIVLLGLQYRDSVLEIISEPLFTIATDNIPMTVIQGTDDGRIFLGGKDGCLYEAQYQGPGTWLGKRCWKINHSASFLSFLIPAVLDFSGKIPIVQIEIDNSRHILFTRFKNGTIDVYDLGSDGKSTSRVASRTWHSISSQAASLARNIEAENFRTISKICIVEDSESSCINMIVFTDTGIRIFFSTSRDLTPNRRPDTLEIVHIRLPPGYSATSPPQRPTSVHLASYRRGTTIMVSMMNDGRTLIWALSSDAFPFESQFMELFSLHPISSRTWDLQEKLKTEKLKMLTSISVGPNKTVALEPPVLVTQDMEDQRRFFFLSSQGVHLGSKPRPVDHLKQLLIDNQGFENEPVRNFFHLYGEAQSCCMALSLACQTVSHLEKQIAEWATLAFFRYGGDPQVTTTFPPTYPQASGPMSTTHQIFPSSPSSALSHNILQQGAVTSGPMSPPLSSTPRASPIYQSSPISSPTASQPNLPYSPQASMIRFSSPEYHEYQRLPYRNYIPETSPPGMQATHGTVYYEMSNKLIGLYLCISRIVRPIWSYPAVKVETVTQQGFEGTKEIFYSSILDDEINQYLDKLSALRSFLNKNVQFSTDHRADTVTLVNGASVSFANTNQVNPMIERDSFYKALQLIERCIEVLGLWRITFEHNFPSVIELLPSEVANILKSVNFRDLITTGSELCAHLASALVQKYIEDHTATDCISQRLKDACPSIFRSENALQAKAHETLIKARNTKDYVQRSKLIEEGMQTFKRIGARINIRQACELLKSVHAYVDIANLCLSTAILRDTDNICLSICKDSNCLLQRIQQSPKNQDLLFHGDEHKLAEVESRLECYKIVLEVYEYLLSIIENSANVMVQPTSSKKDCGESNILILTKDEAINYSKAILKSVIASNDKVAHYAFYEWFHEHQQLDKLLEIRSSYVEGYLKSKTLTFGDSSQMMDLLWMYYERNGNYRAAAHILEKQAERHSTEIDLLKRIEYLSRAIICMKSCQSHSALMTMEEKDLKTSGELLHDLEERMEVARLQFNIMESLQQRSDSSSPAVREAIKELNEDLLDITTLYEKFAEKFDLPESQLAIVYTASYHSPELVKELWKKIIDKELANSMIKPALMRNTLLVNKIQNLARMYMPSDRYLPLDFIVQYLENVTQGLDFEKNWLASALLSCGLSVPQLVEIYYKLYRSRDSTISWYRKSIHMLQVSAWLFKKFCENPSSVPLNERRNFTAKCLDMMSEYLIDLQAGNYNDSNVPGLISQFRELQSKLEKMSF